MVVDLEALSIVRVKRYQCRCQRCGYEWTSSTFAVPKKCANCRSAYWDRPRLRQATQQEHPDD